MKTWLILIAVGYFTWNGDIGRVWGRVRRAHLQRAYHPREGEPFPLATRIEIREPDADQLHNLGIER